ncbi:MAG: tandem-95 repeat protein [Candidatus Competibacteraceae bacterium]|nr:tandem-95 repeat protein [Candidatus Competibacteraceae bacterium]
MNPPGLNAVNDTASTAAGTPVSISVLANDTGTGLSLNQVSRPSNGTAVISGNTVIYTPAASFAGSDSFSYTVTDSFGQSASATVTVTVNPPGLNAVNDTASTAAGTPVSINVLANDTGAGLSLNQVSRPSNGTAVISGNTVIYTPAASFAGSDSFTYTIRDSFGQSASATVTVTVNPPGLNAVNDTASTAAGTPVSINVLANDTGAGITIFSVGTPSHGSAVISGSAVVYTPAPGFASPPTDSFTYTIRDSFGQSASATVTVTVNPPGLNAANDTASTAAGTPVSINVLANDTGAGITIFSVGTPSRGSAVISGSAVVYTPAPGFASPPTDSFTYTITDRFGQTASATVTITINPPGLNAANDTASTAAGTPVSINVLANDTGAGLSLNQVSRPSNGTAVISGNTVIYTPAASFAGSDSFTYTIRDSFGQSASATVTVTVNPPGLNAVNDTASTAAGTPVSISVLANDTGTGITIFSVGTPSHGSAVISGSAVVYTPAPGFASPPTDSFTYTITDRFGQTASATVTITINPPGLNAANDTASTAAGTPVSISVLANDTGTGLIISQVSNPSHGSAAISSAAVVYTPAPGFAGTDSFIYTIRDSFGQIASATVTVTVRPPALDAVNDTAITQARTPVKILVLVNDVGTGLAIIQVGAPAHGSAVASADGTITYTPAQNFAGTDTFTYTITDGISTDSATVRVTVIAPTLDAVDDTATAQTRTPVAIPVLANDVGTGLTITQVSTPAHGAAMTGADGAITYTSAPNFTGADTFTYTMTDGINTDTATVTVTVKRSKEGTQKLLESTTDNPNAKEVGRTIGGLCFDQTASATFLRDCDTLINAASNNEPGVGLALEQITPEALGIAADTSQTSVQNQMLSIRSRMASLRSGVMGINLDQLNIQRGGWTLSGRDLRYLLASVGGGGPSADVDTNLGGFGIFASGTFNLGNRDSTVNQTGFDFKTLALTVGADYRLSDQFVLGTAFSYTAINTDVDSSGGSLDTRGYGLTLYGTYYPSDQLYFDGMVNYGWNNYDQQRNVAYRLQNTDVKQRFDSSYGGQQFFVDLGVGYQFTHGNLTFGPEVRLSYLDVKVDSFQERAGNSNPGSAWAVAIDPQDLQSLVSTVGGRVSYLIDQPWGVLQPQLELSWLHEFNDDNRLVRGRFVEGAVVPDNLFQLATDPVDKNYFRLGLGLSARFNRGPSVLIQYRTLFDYTSLEEHAVTTELRWEF